MKPILKQRYLDIIPDIMKSRGYKNVHQVSAVEKIVINSGVGTQNDKAFLEQTMSEIALIAGQRPVVTKARKSISNFKLRQGMPIGVKVTLRGNQMYEFLYRFIAIALPGIRDFRGTPVKFDGNGNYTLGIRDHTIFPEIVMDINKRSIGMDITITTSAKTDDEGRELLKLLGMPFRNSQTTPVANN